MPMYSVLSDTPEEIKQFRKTPWPDQQTFKTPLRQLDGFVAAVLRCCPIQAGALESDEVVFDPTHLLALFERESLKVEDSYNLCLRADGFESVYGLLRTTLADWVDFLFVGYPNLVAIYADHDEYTTFYTRTTPELNALGIALERAGFERVSGYRRGGASDNWR